jgi:type II secretory pathway pseudopilin PulG
MNLAPKASRGYAMAALLVAISVMAVLLSVALPAWSHMIRREKEEELIFRGQQYARAINLYQRKTASPFAPSIEVLIKERMLRKKFKDPLSPNKDGEFQLLYANQGTSPIGAGTTAGGGAAAGGAAGGGAAGGGTVGGGAAASAFGAKTSGAIRGVVSKNTGTSLRKYNDKTHYNEWEFVGIASETKPGVAPGAGPGVPGRGGPGPGGGPLRGNNPMRRGGPGGM